MQIHLLGPVEVSSNGGKVALGGPKPRALLAMLALDAGSIVSADRLIDGLWGEEPPATAAKMVQLYVSNLRKAMAAHGESDAIATHGRGYQLRLGRDRVDAGRFERLLAQGAAREALRLWRGPPLADVADEPFAAPEIRRLEELRASALEVAIDHDLDAGRHREVLPELEALLAQEPLRERLHAQRMLALYRSGRQAEALEAYRQARATLVEEIGVEPGPELRRLQEAILRQDPSLEPPGQEPAGAPLVGRDAELAHLRELWRRARAGAGTSVLVTGPPGIGKTRLVEELAEEVRRDGGAVAYGELEEVHGPTLLVVEDVARAPEVPPDWSVLAVAMAVEGEGETLPLAPLTRDDVAALARYHAGARATLEPPVDRLVAESGGVPARVHRAAAAWARALATRRIGEAAERASAERAGWHLAGDDVATEVVELQTVRERAQLAGSDPMPACPFKGLASFDVEDAPVFFGRERLVADMIARLPGTRLMGVVGPSGSGKSSALRAGLLAALGEGVLPGSERWPQALIRPGAHPLAALERATAELPAGERWIVAVDQFEEAFTTCRDTAERAAFVDALVACARDTGRRTLLLVAVRADFYGHCAQFSELSRLLGANQVLVGPMRLHELRRAIELPARRAGLRVEPELADALLADVEGEPGALPLLSTALLELWRQRDGRRLTLGAYERTGGVRGAVARLAEGAYERLNPAQREAARRILLRLAGEGGVRVRVPIAELPGDVHDVLSMLAADRLITVGDGEVEVAHEALLREWPRLRAWVDEDADGRRVHRHLTEAARGWDAGGRDAAEVYRGSRLVAASEWAAAHDEELNPTERAFLDASRSATERARRAEAERVAQKLRQNRRLRLAVGIVTAALAAAVAAGLLAFRAQEREADARAVADAGRLGALALLEEDLDRALLLAREGVALNESLESRGRLLAALLRSPAAIAINHLDGDAVRWLDASPDGAQVAAGFGNGTVALLDVRRRRQDGSVIAVAPADVSSVEFSPDGSRLAISSLSGRVGVWDANSRGLGLVLRRPTDLLAAALTFAPDGRTLAGLFVEEKAYFDPVPGRAVVVLWDAATGERRGPPVEVSRRGGDFMHYTRDGRRLVIVNHEGVTVVDARTLRRIRTFVHGGRPRFFSIAASPTNGDLVALLSVGEGTVEFLDLATGKRRRASGAEHTDEAERAVFSPDGLTLATSGRDSKVIVWDVPSGRARETFTGHTGDVEGLAFSADGRTLFSGAGSSVIAWDLEGSRRLGRPFRVSPSNQIPPILIGFAVSPNGSTIAAASGSGADRVSLLEVSTLRPRRRPMSPGVGPITTIRFSPDGRMLAVGGRAAGVALLDAASGRVVGVLREGHVGGIASVQFSPDARRVITGGLADGGALIWDRRTGRRIRALREPGGSAIFVDWSPDGSMVATAGGGGRVVAWRVADWTIAAELRADPQYAGPADFSPDGSTIAAGGMDGIAHVWDVEQGRNVGRSLIHPGWVSSIEFDRRGAMLVTSSTDGNVRLWDVALQRQIGPVLPGSGFGNRAAFMPNGKSVVVGYETGDGLVWDVDVERWKTRACAIAGRSLTREEWAEFLPDRAYEPSCG